MTSRHTLALALSFAATLTGCRSTGPANTEPAHREARNETYDRPARDSGTRSDRREARRDDDRPDARDRTADEETSRAAGEGSRSRRNRHARDAADNTPGQFDFYLLNLSWSPEFCATHTAPECASHPGFVLHGLWPQNSDGTYPQDCSNAAGPTNPSQFADLYPDAGLLSHEWQTHGTCSGLAPDAFFTLARQAVHDVQPPPDLTNLNHPDARSPAAILDDFAANNPSIPRASLALSCGNNYLTAVEVCFSKSLSAIPCPDVRSCGATSVRIVPPNGAQ